jgi:hypothetical protein
VGDHLRSGALDADDDRVEFGGAVVGVRYARELAGMDADLTVGDEGWTESRA